MNSQSEFASGPIGSDEPLAMEHITSQQNPRLKKALRLHSSRGRKQQSRIIIFGNREIERAVAAGVVIREVFASEKLLTTAREWFTHTPTELFSITGEAMQRLQFGDRNEGMVAIADRPETDLASVPTDLQIVVILEQVEKPGNIGAIIRSIDACGSGGLILADPKCDAYHPNAIRSGTGANFSLPIGVGNHDQVQDWLKKNSFRVLTAYLENAIDFFSQPLAAPTAIVLGNEALGLSENWRKPEFQPVKLPMSGIADSLNVSVTASVMLYEAMRQRTND